MNISQPTVLFLLLATKNTMFSANSFENVACGRLREHIRRNNSGYGLFYGFLWVVVEQTVISEQCLCQHRCRYFQQGSKLKNTISRQILVNMIDLNWQVYHSLKKRHYFCNQMVKWASLLLSKIFANLSRKLAKSVPDLQCHLDAAYYC